MRDILNRMGQSQAFAGWLFVLPGMAGLILFIAIPFAMALALSFTNLRLGSPLPTEFIGASQYRQIFSDPTFRQAILNNCYFAAIVVPVQTAAALAIAVVLNRPRPGAAFFRTVFFVPVVFAMPLVAVVWELIYAPGPNGFMNAVLNAASFGTLGPVDWLNNEWLALPAIMLMSIWQGMGFQMVVLLAGLQAIPRNLYEVAEIAGANKWQQFVYVTIPQLRNPLIFTALLTTILAFRVFDQVEIMTGGGPSDATTTVMYEAVTTAFQRQQIGTASAMTVVFFFMVLTLTLIQRALVREERAIE